MFRSMPFVLLIVIALIALLNAYIPISAQQVLYAMSLTVKSAIIFILPVIIFSLLFKTMVSLASRATAVIALILVCVCCSNFLATFLSHYAGEWIYQMDMSIIKPETAHDLMPAWSWQWPKIVDNNIAMFSGIFAGITLGNFAQKSALAIASKLDWLTRHILNGFKYIIPVFVAGFFVKLQYDGVINIIVKDYAAIFGLVALVQFSYLAAVYFILNKFNLRATLSAMRSFIPASIAGFSTMSSAAVMPLTIEGAANNATNKDLARAVIPCTVNIHLLGDCLAIPIFAYAMMKSFAVPEPSLIAYVTFVFYFVIAKFSVAAVPGGGIIVMLPILESHLGFTSDMLSLITALYILFDPVVTCANILGNGAMSKLIDNLMRVRSPQAVQDFSALLKEPEIA